jgi:hypothetical protein
MSRTRTNINQPRRLAIIAAATVGLGTTVLAASTATAELLPPASPACLPIRCAADYLGLPVEHLITELDEDAQASGGTPLDVLVARIDAVGTVRLAVAGRTDGPMQVAAMRFLRDEHDRVRIAILAGTAGDSPSLLRPS